MYVNTADVNPGMAQLDERKQQERDLHDLIRGEGKGEARYTANKKYYSVAGDSNVRFVREWLAARTAGRDVLDYCCGNGETALWLAAHGANVVGIDISPVSVQNATAAAVERGLRERARFVVMDAEQMEFPDGRFDFVTVNGVLHHLDLDKAYAELARVLRPGGQVIATESLRHNPVIQWYRRLTPQMRTPWEVDHILGKSEIFSAERSFDRVEVAAFFHLFTILAVPFRNTAVFRPVLGLLSAIDALALRLPLVKWQAWMAVFVLSDPKKATAAGPSTGVVRG